MAVTVTKSTNTHVAEIHFSRPPFNYASPELIGEIADALEELDRDPEVRCVLLISEGRAFCGGADLAGDSSLSGDQAMTTVAQLYRQASRLFRRTKTLIAVVQGAAVGAGLGLCLAADFRIASPGARFAANFTRLGFHPGFAISYTLPRVIGAQKAGWMMLSSERVKPEQALQWGLVDRLVADGDLIEQARAFAQEISVNAPLALEAVRNTWLDGVTEAAIRAMQHEHAAQAVLKHTDDYVEGVASVFERRPANFHGC